jgi:hypothetical protein
MENNTENVVEMSAHGIGGWHVGYASLHTSFTVAVDCE